MRCVVSDQHFVVAIQEPIKGHTMVLSPSEDFRFVLGILGGDIETAHGLQELSRAKSYRSSHASPLERIAC